METQKITPKQENKQTKPAVKPIKSQASPKQAEAMGMLAIILIRGTIHTKEDIIVTLNSLNLRQKLACTVIKDTSSNKYTAIKCKDYVAFGEISEETYNELVSKRGEKDSEGKLKRYFRLHPPRGGFERKGIKLPYKKGGALGYRGNKMNELIKKML
jgi:large subunit ribosomal protein L30